MKQWSDMTPVNHTVNSGPLLKLTYVDNAIIWLRDVDENTQKKKCSSMFF